jgi:hypothetical protein
MVFALSMIFAFALIAMTTVVMTILALLLMRWMLGLGRFLWHVHTPTGAFIEVEGQASRAILQP